MTAMIKKKVLFVMPLPPPIHGSSLMSKLIHDGKTINEQFEGRFIDLGTSKSIEEIGKNFFGKIRLYLWIIFNTLKQLISFKPHALYVAITAKGIGFYKDMLVCFLARLFHVQLVLHFHNKGVNENQNRFLDNILYRLIFKNSKVILLSNLLYSDIEKYVNEENVRYCPNGIPQMNQEMTERRGSESRCEILFLSNLLISKGVWVLLDALKELKNRGVLFHCNFVGGIGDLDVSDFNNRVTALGLVAEATYLGQRFGVEKSDIYLHSDIFVLPTFNDCFPLVLLEAAQFGLPVVSTDQGAIPEIIDDGQTGLIVDRNEPSRLADKLEILIKDPSLRGVMGRNARKKYQLKYTVSSFEENFVKCLHQLLN